MGRVARPSSYKGIPNKVATAVQAVVDKKVLSQ
jgi:hypothetical protein